MANEVSHYTTDLELKKCLKVPEDTDVRLCYFDAEDGYLAVLNYSRFGEGRCMAHVWDFMKRKFTMAFHVPDSVLAVRIRKQRLYLCTAVEIKVFSIDKNPRKIKVIPTGNNFKGLLAFTPDPAAVTQIMAFPTDTAGQLRIMDLVKPEDRTEPANLLQAHNSDLAYIVMTSKADKIATASVKGTIIRIFDTASKTKLHELRRGVEHAEIFSINFCQLSENVCVSSSTGTVHVFSLKKAQEVAESSWFGLFSHPRSFTSVKIEGDYKPICFFNKADILTVIGQDGTYYKYIFRKDGTLEFVDKGCVFETEVSGAIKSHTET